MLTAKKVIQDFKNMTRAARKFLKENSRGRFTMTAAQMKLTENRLTKFKAMNVAMATSAEIDNFVGKISALTLKRKLEV